MPRIPEYNEQFRYAGRAGNLGARLNPGDFGGTAAAVGAGGQMSGREWQLAGAALTGATTTAAAIYDDYNTAKAQSAVNGLQKNFLAWQSEMSQKKGEAAMEAGAEYEQWQQRQMAELTRGMNEIQRGRFAALAEVKAAGFQKWAADYGGEQGLVYRNAEDVAGIRTEAENLAANLANVDMAKASEERIKDLAFRIGQRKGLGEEASKALMRDSLAEAVTPAIAAQIAAGKLGTARTALAHYENAIGTTNALKLQAAIKREEERLEAKARAARIETRMGITRRSEDAVASWLNGAAFDNAPSREELIAAYGAEQGKRLFDGQEESRRLGEDLTTLRAKTPAEQEALLEARMPAEGEGYAQRILHFNKLQKALAADAKQREDDPAGYVAAYAPEVKEARQAMWDSFTPENVRAYVMKTRSAMEARGLSFPADAPAPVLSESDAHALASRIAAAPDKLEMLHGLANAFGASWLDVERQLATGEKLPPAISVVAAGMEGRPASLLLKAAGTGDFTAGAKQALGQNYTTMQQEVDASLAGFLRTVRASGDMRTELKLRDSTEKLAAQYMLMDNSDARSAARKAAEDIITARYTLKGSYRVPKTLDADLVDLGAQKTLAKLAGNALTLELPEQPGLTREQIAVRYGGAIMRCGEWVTDPDEGGLVLFAGGMPARNADGSLVRRTWAQLREAASDTYHVGLTAKDIKEMEEMGEDTL